MFWVYVSVDQPVYNNLSLGQIVEVITTLKPLTAQIRRFFFFDEVQYFRNWEQKLKILTDRYPENRFVVSGSAATALKTKSLKSGAGRFADFILPPLTFDEFLSFQSVERPQMKRLNLFAINGFNEPQSLDELDISYLNILYARYLSYGGYPEAVMNVEVQNHYGICSGK